MLQGVGQNLVHMGGGNELQGAADRLVDLLQVGFIVLGDDDRVDAVAQRRHGFFPQAADGQNPAPEGDFSRHGHISPNRNSGEGRDHGRGDGHSGGGAVLGHRALGEVDVNVFFLVEVGLHPQLDRPAADIGEGRPG